MVALAYVSLMAILDMYKKSCSLGSHKIKASALGIYAVLSTAARYISSTPLGYVNCFDKQ